MANEDRIANSDVGSKLRPLVISLHGIRTRGAWQKGLGHELNVAGFDYLALDFGFFRALQLFWPPARRRHIIWFRDQYSAIVAVQNGEVPSVIGHSFGSYIVTRALEMFPHLRLEGLILCGSIVRRDYPWSSIILERGQVRIVLNDVAGQDFWAKVVGWMIRDSGPSGSEGFEDNCGGAVIDIANPEFRHSDSFYVLNYRQNWIPFLKGEVPRSAAKLHPPAMNWRFFLSNLLFAVFLASLFSLFAWRHIVDRELYTDGSTAVGIMTDNIPQLDPTAVSSTLDEGVQVKWVAKGSPADLGGLQSGDLIRSVNKRRIRNESMFHALMAEWKVKEKVLIEYGRGSDFWQSEIKVVNGLVLYQRGCNAENMTACTRLGAIFYYGHKRVPQDTSKAQMLFDKACAREDVWGCQGSAMTRWEGGDKRNAINLASKACTGGVSDGCYLLALAYFHGDEVMADETRAAELHLEACKAGNEESCYWLGTMYETGSGVEESGSKAMHLYMVACRWENAKACSRLRQKYSQHIEVKEYERRALEANHSACDGGNLFSCVDWGHILVFGSMGLRNEVKGLEIFERICKAGEMNGCLTLSNMKYRGIGSAQDREGALQLASRVCASDTALKMRGCVSVGIMQEAAGKYEDARVLYTEACDQNEAEACSSLGSMYLFGRGLMKDEVRASDLLDSACRRGVPMACSYQGSILMFGSGPIPHDEARGFLLAKGGCDLGDAVGCKFVGDAFKYGKYVKRNLENALSYYRKSCGMVQSQACNEVHLSTAAK